MTSEYTTKRLPALLKQATATLSLLAALVLSPATLAEPCSSLQGSAAAAPVSVHCGSTPSAVLDDAGRLWVAFEQQQHVWVSYSDDLGASFSAARQVNSVPEDIEHNGEGRPKLQVSAAGTLLLSWTLRTSRDFTGEIRFSRSTDGGASFAPPRTINDDGLFTGHRFDELFLANDGTLYLSWIDKRDMEAAVAQQRPYPGAAIYYAVSTDDGASFAPNRALSANSCECCRIAMAPYADSGVALFFRQIYGSNVRDHAFAVLGADADRRVLQRATVDDWQIDACPHHGPSMLGADAAGTYHLAWFSGGSLQNGILYGRHDLATGSTDQVLQVDARPGAGHPWLARHGGTLFLVWKGFADGASELLLRVSQDEGANWSPPRILHQTRQNSDHPMLLGTNDGVYLSWWTQEYGYLFERITNDEPGN